jgi:hypothetical protein
MVRLRLITMTQIIEIQILTRATTLAPASVAGRSAPSAWLIGVAHAGWSKWPAATWNPRIPKPHTRTVSTTYSTK